MNATFKIDWGEKITSKYGTTFKGTFIRQDGSKLEAVISQRDKNGVEFPNFDQLAPGRDVVGVEWRGAKGAYIFAPKATRSTIEAPRGNTAAIGKAMERKETSIAKFQDSKETSIKLTTAMSKGIDLAIAELGTLKDHIEYERRMAYWRRHILDTWGDETDVKSPF